MKGELKFEGPAWDNISKEAKDLLSKIICKEACRFSTEKILEHEWLANPTEKLSSNELVTVTAKLKKYSSSIKLEKALRCYISSKIENEDIQKLKNTFKALDINGDGKLSYEEFLQSFKGLMSPDQIKKLITSIDVDSNGNISYNEFLAAAIEEHIFLNNDYALDSFKYLDTDKNRKISLNEFKSFLSKIFSEEYTKQMLEIIKLFDLNSDEEIDWFEFKRMLKKFWK